MHIKLSLFFSFFLCFFQNFFKKKLGNSYLLGILEEELLDFYFAAMETRISLFFIYLSFK